MTQKKLSIFIAIVAFTAAFAVYAFVRKQISNDAMASSLMAGFHQAPPAEEARNQRYEYLKKLVRYEGADNLLEIMGQDVRLLFAEPELVRIEKPTVMWQYRSESCVLDVYFSSPDEDPDFSPVVHYEMRARGADDIAGSFSEEHGNACLAKLITEKIEQGLKAKPVATSAEF